MDSPLEQRIAASTSPDGSPAADTLEQFFQQQRAAFADRQHPDLQPEPGGQPSPLGKLAWRPGLYRVQGTRFLTARVWRSSTRLDDYDKLVALKRADQPDLAVVDAMAGELVRILLELFGQLPAAAARPWVTFPPRSAGYFNPHHLAELLATSLARQLQLPVTPVFMDRRGFASSPHPANRNQRGPLDWRGPDGAQPIDMHAGTARLCLLVDDLVVTGTTLVRCAEQLVQRGPVLSLAWLNGLTE